MNLACALLIAACMTSCAAESTEPETTTEVSFSLEKTFNARSLTYQAGNKNMPDLSQLPPVSIQEAEDILHTLREQKNLSEDCTLEATEGTPGQKLLTISSERSVGKNHRFTLQLSMITYEDDGSLYYKDCKAFASSSLYKWHLTGFGLASTQTAGLYTFECASYLYFRIVGEKETFIQVPVKVTGEYKSNSHQVNFTYSL